MNLSFGWSQLELVRIVAMLLGLIAGVGQELVRLKVKAARVARAVSQDTRGSNPVFESQIFRRGIETASGFVILGILYIGLSNEGLPMSQLFLLGLMAVVAYVIGPSFSMQYDSSSKIELVSGGSQIPFYERRLPLVVFLLCLVLVVVLAMGLGFQNQLISGALCFLFGALSFSMILYIGRLCLHSYPKP